MWYKILAWILKTKTYRNLVRNVLSGWTVRRYGWPSFKGSKYWEIKAALEKSLADKGKGIFVFCSVDTKMVSYKLNRRLTDCKFNHSGIIFKDPAGELAIKHINPFGYIYEPLLDFLGRVDHFYVGRMPLADLKEGQRRLDLIEDLIQKPYLHFDYDYSIELEPTLIDYVSDPDKSGLPDRMLNSVKLYCSEFIYLIGYKLVTDEDFKARWFHDRYIFEPDDVYRGTEPLFDV